MRQSPALSGIPDLNIPIIQAPMAGADSAELAAAVSAAGGLGSIGAATHSAESLSATVSAIREQTSRPFNLNFFCHSDPSPDPAREARWLAQLAPYYAELGATPPETLDGGRAPFGDESCALVENLRPAVVSFHFGLPPESLMTRVRKAGAFILASATTPTEARWLASRGVDAIIAQGSEAGGHRGVFAEDWRTGSGMIGTMALVPLIVDVVSLPVIAAGGIADGRGVAAALALGAAAAQIGTAYLATPEAGISEDHRTALFAAPAEDIVVTNVVSGRPARGVANRLVREMGPISEEAPEFPRGVPAVAPLRRAAEASGSVEFSPLWAGQAAPLSRRMPAGELTKTLWSEAQAALTAFCGVR
ncbi:MAG: 2-nitropropane dioxygenase [Alphaproteobacteria bacterium]|nr:2-nitropropane dioxygenase [Alphaproteobacteria bacterium]